MKFHAAIFLLSVNAFTSTFARAEADLVPHPSQWKAGVPAIHTGVRDQGDVSFCWANAWTSYLESKILIEQNKEVRLSEMFVARAHMAHGYIYTLDRMNNGAPIDGSGASGRAMSILSRYQQLKQNPLELSLSNPFLTRKLQNYSMEDLEGFTINQASSLGILPFSIYQKENTDNAKLGPNTGSIPPYENRYVSPMNSILFKNFIANRLMDQSKMERYLRNGGVEEMERDFDLDAGNTPLSEFDLFTFEGKQYTSHTFLRDYVKFNPRKFRLPSRTFKGLLMNAKTGDIDVQWEPMPIGKFGKVENNNFEAAVTAIQNELDQRRPVLLSMLVLDDVRENPNFSDTGLMDPAYCKNPGHCKSEGGHAVMIVNSMKDENGVVKAFIIQNSWGPEGLTDTGVQTKVRAHRGFNIVTIDYLNAGSKFRDYAFSYMML